MTKFTGKIALLVLLLSMTIDNIIVYGADKTETYVANGITLEVKQKVFHGGSDKSGSISPTISGHYLTVSFTENLGQITIEVSTVSGTSVHFTSTPTPNGVQCYIPNAGDYIVTFTLPNGDEYYGEFTVTD